MERDEQVDWCEHFWNMINDGGIWAVPRSGLMFRKDETRSALVLYDRMPHHEDMEITAYQLRAIQDGDLRAIRDRFSELGILVVDETVFVS